MALTRAMGSALSGLNAQQTKLDVVGDNLANATTTGFKASRVNFETMLSQSIRLGSSPQGNLGGVDPVQIGLGVGVAHISRDFSKEGEFRATGLASDVAIDGSGFFILSDAQGGNVYTRDGSFSIDPANQLHAPGTGFIVQGVNADYTSFTIPTGGALENVVIPVGDLQIAAPTTTALFDGNLNSGGDLSLMGTVLQSAPFVDNTAANAPADATTLLENLSRANGLGFIDLSIDAGDTIAVNAMKDGRPLPEARFFVGNSLPSGFDGFGTTLGDFSAFLQRALGVNQSSTLQTGAIRDNDANPNTTGVTFGSPAVFAPSSGAAWTLTQPGIDFDAEGVQVGDIIRWNNGPGTGQLAQITAIGGGGNDTLTLTALGAGLPLPVTGDQYSIHQPAGVSIVDSSVTPWLTDGALLVAGNVGLANAITNLSVRNVNDDINVAPFTQVEAASGESVVTSAVVYDSIGGAHRVEFTFVLEARGVVDPASGVVGNTWRVFAESPDSRLLGVGGTLLGTDRVIGGGQVFFSTEGQFLSQTADATGFASIQIPNAGALTPLAFAPDFSEMTGFAASESVAVMIDQDGFATGILTDFNVETDGTVRGIFSNGETRPLARILLARFNNPNGLDQIGNNLFKVSVNSGGPIVADPGVQGLGTVVGGALEQSNVDFAQEFSDLIVAQRAFQANARVISRSDQLLDELMNIV